MAVIGVAGATGALGREIIKALESVPYKPDEVVPLARASSKTPFVEFDGRDIAVDDIRDEVLDRLDLLFLALPPDAAMEWGTEAIRQGVAVVDLSGAMHGAGVPMGIPWVNPEALASAPGRALCVPCPEAVLAASVLGPLDRAGLAGPSEATFFVPASMSGRDAIQELSAQVVALFNAGTPPRKIFRDGLAFDLLPSAGEPTGSGWTASEGRVADQVRALLDIDFTAVRVGVPVFSGLSMELRIEPQKRPVVDLVGQILRDGGVELEDGDTARALPRPRRVEGRPFAQAGRIRVDQRGEVLRIWGAMDNLRASATVAVGLGGILLR
ncbi:MAG: Asd/ArgC dimerization domain-containing protein [Myxococcota bacterium]